MDAKTRQTVGGYNYSPPLGEVVAAMKRKKYVIFDDARGHNVNIVGIRGRGNADAFDDCIALFYRTRDSWSFFAFPATTDPGTYYRENPVNVRGTAILKPGQYRRAFAIGTHRDYPALVQVEPVTVYRDANRDGNLDIENAPEETGMFDIHIHRAGPTPVLMVGRWSAGCQVFQDAAQFDFFIAQCNEGARKYGNRFTYTLLTADDLKPPRVSKRQEARGKTGEGRPATPPIATKGTKTQKV